MRGEGHGFLQTGAGAPGLVSEYADNLVRMEEPQASSPAHGGDSGDGGGNGKKFVLSSNNHLGLVRQYLPARGSERTA